MAKISAKSTRSHPEPTPEPPPEDVAVDAEPYDPPSPRRPRPQSVTLPRAPIDVPQGAASWTIEDMSGASLGAMNPEGVEVYEWPILGFTTAFVRSSWGAGRYVVRFKDATGKSWGRKRFALGARDVPPEATGAPAAPMVAPDDPITRGFQMMTAIDGFAQAKADRQAQLQQSFLIESQANAVRMFEAAMGRDARVARQEQSATTPPPWAVPLIAGVQDLARRVADLEGDDPDDPDAEPPPSPFPDSWDDALSPRSLAALASKLPDLVNTLGTIVQTMQNAKRTVPPPPVAAPVVNPAPEAQGGV